MISMLPVKTCNCHVIRAGSMMRDKTALGIHCKSKSNLFSQRNMYKNTNRPYVIIASMLHCMDVTWLKIVFQ